MIFNFTNIQSHLRDLLIFSYLDLFEILTLSCAVYYFARWLQQDQQHNLAPLFFTSCLAVTGANYLGLTNLSQLVLNCWPLVIMLFVLIHQQTLQKNLVALKKIKPAKTVANPNWIENLIAATLTSPQPEGRLRCILEGQDSLSDFLTTEFMINCPLNKPLLETVLNSPHYDSHKILWLTQAGQLVAINSTWQTHPHAANLEPTEPATSANCLLLSQQTDLIYLEVNQQTHQFNLITHGQTAQNLHTNDVIKILHQAIRKNQVTPKTETGVNWHDLKKSTKITDTTQL